MHPVRLALGSLVLVALAQPAAAQSFRTEHSCGTKQVAKFTGPPPVAAAAATRTIYLNKNGGTYQISNAATNAASNVANVSVSASGNPRTANIAPIEASFDWPWIVQCVRDAYARYDVRITETEPTSGNFIEAVVGGTGTELGYPNGQLFGIASADNFCGVTERGIAFNFSATHVGMPNNTDDKELCATIAHEVGHLLALEHETLATDEMSYVLTAQAWPKRFEMANSPCGTQPGQNQPCSCGGSQTNSHMRLSQFVGLRATETVPPTVAITAPGAETLPRTFTITATAADASGIQEVAFKVDGVTIGTDSTPDGETYSFQAVRLAEGPHTIVAEALDNANNRASASVDIEVSFDCGGCGSGQVCVEGECFVDNGETCVEDIPCAGGLCLQTSSGDTFCSQVCDLATDDCPSGFACLDVGAGDGTGVCDFSDDGGCCSTGGDRTGSPFAAIGLGAISLGLIVSRRRKRR
jgi:LPXTG-motif cell wall-anchored protein